MQSPTVNQAMEVLREMRQITGGQASIQEKLEQIVALIANKMSADAANCYVAIDDYTLELFASYGYNPEVAHKIYLRFSEGLVGEVAQNNRSLAVADAWSHPKFSYKPDLGEENYKSFLGVPLIRWNRAIGVLSVQHREQHEYSAQEIDSLETVAMVLSELVSSDEMNEYKK